MRVIRALTMFVIISTLIYSCSIFSEKKAPYNPTTLKELHNGFFDEELTPEILKSDKKEITIIATGHLYPLLNYPKVYNTFIDTIINQKPDYIFLLGDLIRDNTNQEWDSVLTRFNKVGCKLFFAPGNHDLNYHYERWEGSREHEFEAEMKYIDHVGYRYKLLQDNFANYVFINPNDSIDRVLSYLDIMKSQLDTTKMLILLTSQSLWHNLNQIPGDNHSWVNKAFTSDEILPKIEYFDYLIHGDWGGHFYLGTWPKSKGKFNVMSVGNRKQNDSLFVTKIVISNKHLVAEPIKVVLPKDSPWFDSK